MKIVSGSKAFDGRQGLYRHQGDADIFLAERLTPELLRAARSLAHYGLTLRMQPIYDHGYGFSSTFTADHGRCHVERLSQRPALTMACISELCFDQSEVDQLRAGQLRPERRQNVCSMAESDQFGHPGASSATLHPHPNDHG